MLAAVGYDVTFVLTSGARVRASRGAALLHDEDGSAWPSCSAIVLPFRRTKETLGATPTWIRKYFGIGHALRRGEVVLPPRSFEGWQMLGRCERIDYRRIGVHAAEYTHPFGEGASSSATWLTRHPRLYRRDGALRLELGRGCVWNWRGIVRP